ncbi:MAG: sulfatase [Candidatus Aminicenantes bacterium]|nr:sulfatase [Candidatus Aminicenantes bacterium]
MTNGKGILKEVFYFLSLAILLAFFLTCLFFPYNSIIANRFLKFGFYQSILFEFFKIFFPFIQISMPIVFSGYFTHRTISSLSNINIGKTLRVILVTLNIAVIAGGISLSTLIAVNRNSPAGSSLLFLIAGGFIFIIIIRFAFKFTKKSFRKTIYLTALTIFFLVMILFTFFNNNRSSKSPNILFIVVDTLRPDHTSIEDPELGTTAYLKDTLLPDSIYFRKGYSNSPWTLPSVSSMITSRYPSQLGIRSLISKIDEEDFTITELMREEGYRTGAVISHILLKESYGISQGFDYFNDRNISGEFGNHIAISSPGVTKDAINFIQAKKGGKFFLFLHYFDPHYIYLDHEKETEYKGKFRSKDISYLREQIRKDEYSGKDTEYLKYCYNTEIRLTDFYIGKVINELKRSGIYENTIIIFTSDHGEEFIERGWLGHSTTLYKEQTGVPIIIKPVDKSHLSLRNFENIPVSNIDLVPTLISMAGLKRMPGISGKDLFNSDPDNHDFFGEVSQKEFGSDIELVSVTWRNWKVIKDLNNNRFELYNINEDIEEKENIIGSVPDISSKLKLKIQKWMKNMRKPGAKGKKRRSLSDSEREKLKTLGYIN